MGHRVSKYDHASPIPVSREEVFEGPWIDWRLEMECLLGWGLGTMISEEKRTRLLDQIDEKMNDLDSKEEGSKGERYDE